MNLQLYLIFYHDNRLLGIVNEKRTFKLFRLEDLPEMVERFEKRGAIFRAGYVEIRDNDKKVFNIRVFKSVNKVLEYDMNSIDKTKKFITDFKEMFVIDETRAKESGRYLIGKK